MSANPSYVLDSDVFIAAKNAYYAFEICPGFWQGLLRGHVEGRVGSIDRIRGELLLGRKEEDLVQWVEKTLPRAFFQDSSSGEVSEAYTEVMLWVQRSRQYLDRAKAKFATEADGWLVAYSMVHRTEVVTNEQPRPDARGRVLLPDVCAQFGIPFRDPFFMLRQIAVRLDLRQSG